ncbi:MAG TPA: hypothetical protein VNT24_00350 [Propionibacteriaceae bacterium]|nr:hypothetical protein [Propionibacteriaceae bacterium]
MTEADQTATTTEAVPSETPTRPLESVPTSNNGAQSAIAAEPAPITPAPTAPPATASPAAPRGSTARTSVAAITSKWVIIHPHVSYFSWLADKQGPVELPPEARLARYRQESPWLFRICVLLDLLVLVIVTGILVAALAAALYKTIWGVV